MNNKKWIILIVILFFLSFSLITIGSLFKLSHWPNASILLMSGVIGNIVTTFIGLIFAIKLIVKSKDTNKPSIS